MRAIQVTEFGGPEVLRLADVPVPEPGRGTALALLVQGLTAWHLYRTSARIREGESVVVHAGAGGVGSLAVQLGRPMGAGRVIATASSEEKRDLALELGADAAVDSAPEGLADRLRRRPPRATPLPPLGLPRRRPD